MHFQRDELFIVNSDLVLVQPRDHLGGRVTAGLELHKCNTVSKIIVKHPSQPDRTDIKPVLILKDGPDVVVLGVLIEDPL